MKLRFKPQTFDQAIAKLGEAEVKRRVRLMKAEATRRHNGTGEFQQLREFPRSVNAKTTTAEYVDWYCRLNSYYNPEVYTPKRKLKRKRP